MDRREFLKAGVSAAMASKIPLNALGSEGKAATAAVEIARRTLGRTGEKVSMVGLGGWHIGVQKTVDESIRIIRTALDRGVNFLDNCWDYNDGESERRMGKALRDGYRAKAFLMTKIDGRNKDTAAKQINESLKRLETDHLDLLQFHEIIRISDPDHIFAADGALHAAVESQKAGKVRYIGFTGHKNPHVHLKMIETAKAHGFNFDSVQMPLNIMDAHFESFQKMVVPVAQKENIGILGMKPMGDPFILKSKTVTPIECLHWAMNLPTSVVITGCDSLPILEQAIKAAITFKPLSEKETAALLAKTATAGAKGEFELYKTSHHFDGTYSNPEWLGPNEKKETYPDA